MGTQPGLRNVRTLSLHPFRIVIAYLTPSHHLHAGIVHFTIVLIVATDGAISRHLPTLVIGLQALCGSVCILHYDVDATLGEPKRMNLIGLMLLHREESAIAQHDAETETFARSLTHKGIFLNALCDVIRIIINGLAIV